MDAWQNYLFSFGGIAGAVWLAVEGLGRQLEKGGLREETRTWWKMGVALVLGPFIGIAAQKTGLGEVGLARGAVDGWALAMAGATGLIATLMAMGGNAVLDTVRGKRGRR